MKDQYCTVCLTPQDTIVLDINFKQFDFGENDQLNDAFADILIKEGFTNVFRWYELEYELLSNNIKQVKTEEEIKSVYEKLGIKYIVTAGLSRFIDRENYSFQSVEDKYSPHPKGHSPVGDEATLTLSMLETKTNSVCSQITVISKSDTYSKDDKDGNEGLINLASAWNSLFAGTKRGAKYITADCQCPKGKYIRSRRVLGKD
ncbi:hypothetical protein [Echinicola pacifica]|uniref:hypothetical protein n=1 Tax=Echinicola pacifica TaxID=346377 RepID=UPI0012FB2906|nr:hypothetical protein [Echinicola pacifica]